MAASSGAEAGAAAAAPVSAPAPVSFGFSRKAERRRVLAAGPCAESGDDDGGGGDTEFLTAVEGRELLSTRPPPPPPQELVIPLRPPRCWKPPPPREDAGPASSAGPASPQSPLSVEAQAVQELLQEARQSQEQSEGPPSLPMAIPLRPQDGAPQPQPGPEDYQAVPVAAFGLALLRGMGWRQGEGIGRTFKRVVKPLEHRLRPRGLGLGAELAPSAHPPHKTGPPPKGEDPSPGTGGKESVGGGVLLAVGAAVRVEAGPHRGMEGKVEGLDPETARALVRLDLGGQVVTVSQHSLRAGRSSKKGAEEELDSGEAKRKEPPPSERSPKRPRSAPPSWLRRQLRVRCVDPHFRAGRFYNCKMVVEDMATPDTCVCRTDEGQLVEGLQAAMLETVIPRGSSDCVMVVLGKDKGRVGRILEREPGHSRALVQLEGDAGGRVVPLDYDAICHYVGGHEDD